jgi:hypothetical protein
MDKKIILAKAGAGKTYYICHSIDPNRRNLILAFTNQNISNIIRELQDANKGTIPESTTISTFHSFVYHTFIRPFESVIASYFNVPEFKSDGVNVTDEPEPRVIKKNRSISINFRYITQDKIGHYYTSSRKQIYVSRMSELPLVIKSKQFSIAKMGISYLNKFYDKILIDEVQDFRDNDWKLLEKITKGVNDVTLVGDFYQHSVSGSNLSGQPFDKYVLYDDYIKYLQKTLKLNIDENTLRETRRCPNDVCIYVTRKIGIPFPCSKDNKNTGGVIEVSDVAQAISVMKDDSITKLVWDESKKCEFKAINWGYSKGDTYPSVCVILTNALSNSFFKTGFALNDGSSKNKLYVALTRTKGDLYIMSSALYKNDIKGMSPK